MTGIEILNQQLIPITQKGTLWALPFAIILLLLFALLVTIDWVIPSFLLMFIVLGLMIYDLGTETKVGEYIEYKVTISNEVNFNEFNDKYEILNQEGKIYTIKEKDKEIKGEE